jgi:EAL domain-containing protein (putative c-di-GMP-specific phosphodiesterase class I)
MASAADLSIYSAPVPKPEALGGSDPESDGSRRVSTRDRSKGKVLVVDDETILRRGIQRLLQAKGYEVITAEDGRKAHELFRTQAFDVVLSDIAMPGWDGIQLLRSVRDIDADVPVVLITGEPAVATAVKALEYGAFHYLTKPVDMQTLEEVVDKAACLRRMAQMKRQAAELLGHDLKASHDLQSLQESLSRALGSLWMAYQPIVHADSGVVFGYEALLRSDEKSLPHPGAVLDAAERLGQLDVLGRTIRDRSAEPMIHAPPEATLFVNLHTTDLLDEKLLSGDAPLSKIARRVVLEITERSSLDNVKDVRGRVARLREMGFRIAVDDLGAGYAGLTSFALLEPEIVKLDMSLIRDVHLSRTRQKLIRSMTDLCKDMGMLVVGEGVEIREEREMLVELGCDLLQGYMLAKPGRPFPAVSW